MVALPDLISALIVPFAATTFGFALGWVCRSWAVDRQVSKRAITNGLAVIVTLTWMLSVLTAMTTASYETGFALHAIMGAVVGYFFGDGSLSIFQKG